MLQLHKTEILKDLGRNRSESEEHKERRQADIDYSRKVKQQILLDRFKELPHEQKLEAFKAALAKYPEILASGKEISDWLDLEYLVAARIVYEEGLSSEDALQKAILLLSNRQRNAELTHRLTNIGLEIELGRPRGLGSQNEILRYTNTVDSLQEIGIMIDSDSLREIKLPKSEGTYEQAWAGYELERFGVITEDQTVGIQINVSGIENPAEIFGDLVVAHLMFSSTNYFGSSRIPIGKSVRLPDHSQKSTREDITVDWFMPSSVPVRIKSGDVVEFRGVFKKWEGSLGFAKSLSTFGVVLECIAAYSADLANNIPPEEMSTQARLWLKLKAEFFEAAEQVAQENNVKTLANIHNYINNITFYAKVLKTVQFHTDEMIRIRELEPDGVQRIQREDYILVDKQFHNVCKEILVMSKDDDEFWIRFEEASLKYLTGEIRKEKEAAVQNLRKALQKGEDINIGLSDRIPIYMSFYTLWKSRYDGFSSVWSDAIAISKFEGYRKGMTNKLIEARASYKKIRKQELD